MHRHQEAAVQAAAATSKRRNAQDETVPAASLARYFFDEHNLEELPHTLPAGTWIAREDGDQMVEHSIASSKYGTVLSMLWLSN